MVCMGNAHVTDIEVIGIQDSKRGEFIGNINLQCSQSSDEGVGIGSNASECSMKGNISLKCHRGCSHTVYGIAEYENIGTNSFEGTVSLSGYGKETSVSKYGEIKYLCRITETTKKTPSQSSRIFKVVDEIGLNMLVQERDMHNKNDSFSTTMDVDIVWDARYGNGTRLPGGPGWMPEDSEMEEGKERTYSLRIIDQRTDRPVAQASITADGKEYRTDKNGIAVVKGSRYIQGLAIREGDSIIHSETGYYAVLDQVNTIYVNGLELEAEDIRLGASGETTVQGPEVKMGSHSFSLFELPFGFEANLLDVIDVAYDPDEKVYQVLAGDREYHIGKKTKDAKSPAWKKMYQDTKRAFQELDDSIAGKKKTGNKKIFPLPGDVGATFFLEIAVTEKGLAVKDGGMLFSASVEASHTQPLPPAPYIYLKFGASAEFSAQATFVLEKATFIAPQFGVTADLSLTITPFLGIGAGLDKVLAAEAGIEGPIEAKLSLPFESMEKSAEMSMTADVYIRFVALALQLKFSKKFAETQLYPRKDGKALTLTNRMDGAELIGRDYLSGRKKRSGDDSTLKAPVYPYGGVQAAPLSDGRVLLVWLDDDTERNLMNKRLCTTAFWRAGYGVHLSRFIMIKQQILISVSVFLRTGPLWPGRIRTGRWQTATVWRLWQNIPASPAPFLTELPGEPP